jgi:hypothetical protein
MSDQTASTGKVEYDWLQGNTYPVRDGLKKLGARWDPGARLWKVPTNRYQEALALLDTVPKSMPGRCPECAGGGYLRGNCPVCG